MIIAIDPGKSGGIAVHSKDGTEAFKMPDSQTELCTVLQDYARQPAIENQPIAVYLEQVGGFTKSQEGGQPGSAMFRFGEGFGYIKGVCDTLGFRLVLVRPQDWMKTVSAGTRGERSKTQWKNHLKDIAQRRYPHIRVTLSTADALLILEHAKNKENINRG